jgi:hypothetical protein
VCNEITQKTDSSSGRVVNCQSLQMGTPDVNGNLGYPFATIDSKIIKKIIKIKVLYTHTTTDGGHHLYNCIYYSTMCIQ